MNILNNISLSIRSDGTYTPFSADAWGYAGQMTLLGLLMVFAVLATLWLVLTLFKVIFAERAPKADKKKEVRAEVSAVPSAADADTNDETELIAVITAAVAAYISEEKGEAVDTSGFRVVSFRRTNAAGRSWNEK